MAEVMYNVGKARIASGVANLASGDIRAVVVKASKTGADNVDLDTMAAIDAVGSVAFGPERVALTSLTVTADNTNDRANVSAANFTFASAPGDTALALIIYDNAGGADDTVRYPIAFYDSGFGAGLGMDGGLAVTINGAWLRLS